MFCGIPENLNTDLNRSHLRITKTVRFAIANFFPDLVQVKTYEQTLAAFET